MYFTIRENCLWFKKVGISEGVEVQFPTEAPIYSICHRPEVHKIIVSLVDYAGRGKNQCCNVFAVDDRTGEIVWRIKEGIQRPPGNQNRKPLYHTLQEFEGDPNLYCLDTWNTKWKIDLETGEIDEFERGTGH